MSTKILTGSLKGRKLVTPNEARPSKAILRKSLMDQIRFELVKRNFLDLFAGSGAMGLEAISNKAVQATFVDHNAKSIGAIRQNIATYSLSDITICLHMDALSAIDYFFDQKIFFDFIFADPPYNQNLDLSILQALDQKMILRNEGHFFLETNQIFNDPCKNLHFVEKRKFGKSYLYHYQK